MTIHSLLVRSRFSGTLPSLIFRPAPIKSRTPIWLCALLILLLLSAQTACQKHANQTAGNTGATPSSASPSNTSAAQSSPSVLVGTIVKVGIPLGATPKWGPGIRVGGMNFVSTVEIDKPIMNATELDMDVGKKAYKIKLGNYHNPSLAIMGGAKIKVTGEMVGDTIYATEIDTIKKPEETMYVHMVSIGKP